MYRVIDKSWRLCALAAALLLAGCAEEAAKEPLYDVVVFTDPARPVPERSARMRMTVARIGGAAVADAKVTVSASGDAGKMDAVGLLPSATAGEYGAAGVVFPAAGTWKLTIQLSSAAGSEALTMDLDVGCEQGGAAGASCCAENACGDGLSCVYGACRAAVHADGGDCHEGADCASGVCTNDVCQAATCSDGVHNGKELALDCGAGCPEGCGGGVACTSAADCKYEGCWNGVCALPPGGLIGKGDGSTDSVKFTTILSGQVYSPADLAFSTNDASQLWIVNPPSDSFTLIRNPGKSTQTVTTIGDISHHFLEHVMAISFSDNLSFGTCGDSRNDYNNQQAPNNFMGPVLWPSDPNAYSNKPSAHMMHDDMLHSSPYCMGMAGAGSNTYFVFNGYNGVIDWYDFRIPHVPGGTDHTDGVKRRYVDLQVKRVAGVPSNLQYDFFTTWLYIADTGNGRVLRARVGDATKGQKLPSFYEDGVLHAYNGAVQQQLLPPPGGMNMPSGLAVQGKSLYVGDAATGQIHAFQIPSAGEPDTPGSTFGKYLRSLHTGLPAKALGGMTVGPDRRLYLLDRTGNRVLRIEP